ncbi:MAG: hypothetical protein HYX75_03030 [Acidobacteria bacterium]|nr:hypothetical protein [Acidobacteriota bacterium]
MRRSRRKRDAWSRMLNPVVLENPRFYDLNQRMALAISLALGRSLLLDKERCMVREHHGKDTPAKASFHLAGTVLIMDTRASKEMWIDYRRFVLDRMLGKVAILREEPNVERTVDMIACEAEDLSDPDFFGYVRGHAGLNGRLVQATGLLMNGLRCGEAHVRERAADALRDLFDHLDHDCYDLDERRTLRAAADALVREFSSESDPDVRRAIDRAIDSFQEMKAAGFCGVERKQREGP